MGKEKKMKDHSKGFLKGGVIGVAIGAVTALLLAPKSGKETQADIKNKAKKVARDADVRIAELERELDGRIDNLKVAAKELRGEAYEESQRLITRAELLKQDLQDSATRLAKDGNAVRSDATTDAKRLLNEGSAVLSELEKTTKKIVASAKDKAGDQFKNNDR